MDNIRKDNDFYSILRFVYLYRVFDRPQLADLLGVDIRVLKNQTGKLKDLFADNYTIRCENENPVMKAESEEDYISVHKLWEVYGSQQQTGNMTKSAEQYARFLYGIDKQKDKLTPDKLIKLVFEYYVLPFMNEKLSVKRSRAGSQPKKGSEERDDISSDQTMEAGINEPRQMSSKENDHPAENEINDISSDSTKKARIKELKHMGVVRTASSSLLDLELEKRLRNEEIDINSFYGFLCYSLAFLHPSIYGHELLRLVSRIAKEKGIDPIEPYIKYMGYQAQSILSNEKCMDIIDCIHHTKMLTFKYQENEDTSLRYDEAQKNKQPITNVLPYKMIYDVQYGRYNMIAMDLDKYGLTRDPKGSMRKFRVEYMERLSQKETRKYKKLNLDSLKKKMNRAYRECYDGTWAGRGTEDGRYRKIVFLRCFPDGTSPEKRDYDWHFPCKYQGYDENEHTYYIIVPDYRDIKPWIMEHTVPDGKGGWFEVVREELVERDGDTWKEVACGDEPSNDLLDDLRDTFETMERYYSTEADQ